MQTRKKFLLELLEVVRAGSNLAEVGVVIQREIESRDDFSQKWKNIIKWASFIASIALNILQGLWRP
jgi:hypothetical protein